MARLCSVSRCTGPLRSLHSNFRRHPHLGFASSRRYRRTQQSDVVRRAKYTSSSTDQIDDPEPNGKRRAVPRVTVDLLAVAQGGFWTQLALFTVSSVIAVITINVMALTGAGVSPSSIFLVSGILLAGYSTSLSYNYLKQVKSTGEDLLRNSKSLESLLQHAVVNFFGAASTIIALQASVGTVVVKTLFNGSSAAAAQAIQHKSSQQFLGLHWLTQASANTLIAHLVSLIFIFVAVQRITRGQQHILKFHRLID